MFLVLTERSSAHASPRLKESMDLYEEMVTEEQQSRESSYNEVNRVVKRHGVGNVSYRFHLCLISFLPQKYLVHVNVRATPH